MGQGTNSYNNVQLSRYIAAVANRGTVFELSLLDKLTDSDGNLITDYTPSVSSHVDAADSTWDAVQTGMRAVVSEGSAKDIFKDLEVEIAGKTGTAQENQDKPNHALFIGYAPYDTPEIAMAVRITNGYSSTNAASVAKDIVSYYFKLKDESDIITNTAANVNVSNSFAD